MTGWSLYPLYNLPDFDPAPLIEEARKLGSVEELKQELKYELRMEIEQDLRR